jgi:hypothetical protein
MRTILLLTASNIYIGSSPTPYIRQVFDALAWNLNMLNNRVVPAMSTMAETLGDQA